MILYTAADICCYHLPDGSGVGRLWLGWASSLSILCRNTSVHWYHWCSVMLWAGRAAPLHSLWVTGWTHSTPVCDVCTSHWAASWKACYSFMHSSFFYMYHMCSWEKINPQMKTLMLSGREVGRCITPAPLHPPLLTSAFPSLHSFTFHFEYSLLSLSSLCFPFPTWLQQASLYSIIDGKFAHLRSVIKLSSFL